MRCLFHFPVNFGPFKGPKSRCIIGTKFSEVSVKTNVNVKKDVLLIFTQQKYNALFCDSKTEYTIRKNVRILH